MKNTFEEFCDFLVKNIALIISLMVGGVIKVAIDIKTRQLKRWERALNVLISICVGWIAWKALNAFGKDHWTGFIVPLATLFGETFAMWVILKGEGVLNKIIDKILKVKE